MEKKKIEEKSKIRLKPIHPSLGLSSPKNHQITHLHPKPNFKKEKPNIFHFPTRAIIETDRNESLKTLINEK